MSLKKINTLLKEISVINDERKGVLGEEIAFEVLKRYTKARGNSILINTVIYPYYSNTPGNIKLKDNKFISLNDNDTNDEVDIVLITPYKIFLCEVKAYRYDIEFTDLWVYRSKTAVEKSTTAQAEKHARHFYHNFCESIPHGNSEYIIPVIVIADKSKIQDNRSIEWKNYIHITNINKLNKLISELENLLITE